MLGRRSRLSTALLGVIRVFGVDRSRVPGATEWFLVGLESEMVGQLDVRRPLDQPVRGGHGRPPRLIISCSIRLASSPSIPYGSNSRSPNSSP